MSTFYSLLPRTAGFPPIEIPCGGSRFGKYLADPDITLLRPTGHILGEGRSGRRRAGGARRSTEDAKRVYHKDVDFGKEHGRRVAA